METVLVNITKIVLLLALVSTLLLSCWSTVRLGRRESHITEYSITTTWKLPGWSRTEVVRLQPSKNKKRRKRSKKR